MLKDRTDLTDTTGSDETVKNDPKVDAAIALFEDGIEQSELFGNQIISKIVITAKAAKAILARYGQNNRPLRIAKITYWKEIYKEGRFNPDNGMHILVTVDGLIANGYHRLTALAGMHESFKLTMSFNFGASADSFATIDIGEKRGVGDLVAIETSRLDGKSLAAFGRLMQAYEGYQNHPAKPRAISMVKSDLHEQVQTAYDYQVEYDAAVKVLNAGASGKSGVLSNKRAFVVYTILKKAVGAAVAEEFVKGIILQSDKKGFMPELRQIHDALKEMTGYMDLKDVKSLYYCLTGFNAWRRGIKIKFASSVKTAGSVGEVLDIPTSFAAPKRNRKQKN